MLNRVLRDRSQSSLKTECIDNYEEPESELELEINPRIQYIVFGFVRKAQTLLLSAADSAISVSSATSSTVDSSFYEEQEAVHNHTLDSDNNEVDDGEDHDETSCDESNKENELIAPQLQPPLTPSSDLSAHDVEDVATNLKAVNLKAVHMAHIIDNYGERSTFFMDHHFNQKVSNIILLYYHDELSVNTNILYSNWSHLESICATKEEVEDVKIFYHKLIELGYNPQRLPLYEMIRYYHGTSRDLTRAVAKWKGSFDTYLHYNLRMITKHETKQCIRILSKSCHFCGFHNVDIGKPSPVFVLNYENWNWEDFDDINHVIKASFYICCWMTDNVEAIHNGITFMVNCKGIRFNHIRPAMSLLRAMQSSLALRTNHVFFLNLPSLARNSMKLFLKIYPKHIQDKLHICSNTASLYNLLTSDQIPMVFGGNLDRNNEHDIPRLGTILSNYIDIKDFTHFQVDDDRSRY